MQLIKYNDSKIDQVCSQYDRSYNNYYKVLVTNKGS